MNIHVPSLQRSLHDVVAEYDAKRAAIVDAEAAFNKAGGDLKMACMVGGTYGHGMLNVGSIYQSEMLKNLLTSAWLHVHDGLNIKMLTSPAEKRRFEQAMTSPPPFTLDNIRATFGDFVKNPRASMLRALAEVFCELDPAYKSHEKVKIGVAGLPKRVVMRGFGQFASYGRDHLQTILNALAAIQNKSLVTYHELDALMNVEDALRQAGELPRRKYDNETHTTPGRGIWLRRFKNGNGHLFFDPATLRDINRGLAEFYGDVLPDCTEDRPDQPRASTAVSKDLAYYPTPAAVVATVLADIRIDSTMKILEPSCGCGRFLDGIRKAGGKAIGIEVDALRASVARAKGHSVLTANFLDTQPTGDFDLVVTNPPFAGRHYFKHLSQAMKFLKPGGKLIAILPISARYDHGLLDELIGVGRSWDRPWSDLPVGSFSESGTNINTTILTLRKAA
jgi:hypothetical protein